MVLTEINFTAVIAQLIRHQVYLVRLCMLALIVYLISFLAEITWQLVPEPKSFVKPQSQYQNNQASAVAKASIKRIKDKI